MSDSFQSSASQSSRSTQIDQNVAKNSGMVAGEISGGTAIGTLIINQLVIYFTPESQPELVTAQTTPAPVGENPYRGLATFRETDSKRFFGRTHQIQKLWGEFCKLHEDERAVRLLPIYGPSGSGKSSLARAGLIPELGKKPLPGRDRARVAVLRPQTTPLQSLALLLARIAMNDPSPVAKASEFAKELALKN